MVFPLSTTSTIMPTCPDLGLNLTPVCNVSLSPPTQYVTYMKSKIWFHLGKPYSALKYWLYCLLTGVPKNRSKKSQGKEDISLETVVKGSP